METSFKLMTVIMQNITSITLFEGKNTKMKRTSQFEAINGLNQMFMYIFFKKKVEYTTVSASDGYMDYK